MVALAARPNERLPPPFSVEANSSANASTAPVSTTTSSPDAITLRGSSQDDLQRQGVDGKPLRKAGQPAVDLFPAGFPLPDAGSKRVGVCFEQLVVEGAGGTGKLVESLPMSLLNSFNVWSFVSHIFGIKYGSKRALIRNVTGLAEDGEVLLVLGRPGSGCSTLLRAIANVREPFAAVGGHVQYSTIDAAHAKQFFDGEIVFNDENETHLALLTVEDTLDTALRLKKPRNVAGQDGAYAKDYTGRLLETFGMPHTARTLVGDNFVRGVSGGERKRVSLTEMLAINAAVVCYDNSIRGLDSAVALRYFEVMRELSRATGMTNVVSVYQASQPMYELVDRVIVLMEGYCVFSGRASDAEAYFIAQGWHKEPRQTTPDFLTSCTSPNERRVRAGFEGHVPQTAAEMAEAFEQSTASAVLQADIAAYKARHEREDHDAAFRQGVKASTHALAGRRNPYRKNFLQQVTVLVVRQWRLTLADRRTLVSKIVSNLLQSTLVGAILYKPAKDANGAYATAGGLFFTVLYFVILSFGEIPTTVQGRPLQMKHRALGFYNPAAQSISQMVVDAPLYAVQTLIFSSIIYFLMGLNSGARYFFTFWFIIFTSYMTLAAMFRMVGSWSPSMSVAVRYAGFSLATTLSVAGFIVPAPQMLGWISWLRRASPPAWAFEALMANEFRTSTLTCSDSQLVPSGASYTDLAYQTCTIIGADPGSATVSGPAYILAKYGIGTGDIWRNVGILWAMYVGYSLMVILGASLLVRDTGSSSTKLFARRAAIAQPGGQDAAAASQKDNADEHADAELKDFTNAPVFTYQDLSYTVQVDGQDKKLLDAVSGVVQPGKLCALMGASGAGKTTLLDNLSRRKTTGKIEGDLLIDGRSLDSAFSRRTGFVQQGDIHEPMSTVRECLEFSAILRQDNDRTREERVAFADRILKLLELEPLADALIGSPDVGGLGVEERKRVTIGVELAADPEFLLFLDEPTSGLDSQAAYEILRFLHKITASGLALLVTVHQPSGALFEMFDAIVLLAPGGKVVYSGPTGQNAQTVTEYFDRFDVHCPPDANPAEFLIDTVAPVGGSKVDWPVRWKESPEHAAILRRISENNARNTGSPAAGETAPPSAAFATSIRTQTRELIVRNYRAQWRSGPYWTTKLATLVFFGLFSGFFGYRLAHSPGTVQTSALLILLAVQCTPPLALDIGVNFLLKLDLWFARERNGIYDWRALITALLATELPVFLVGGCLVFFCEYWTVGWTSTAESGALVWLTWIVYSVFSVTFGLLLGAVSPTIDSVPYVLSICWNLFCALSWALVVYSALPSPFKYFFSWLSPLRYVFGSMMTATLGNVALTCRPEDYTVFEPPSGQTCGAYAASFLATATGYLGNPDATSACEYCSSSTGLDYVEQMGYRWDRRWSNWAICWLFCLSNVVVIYAVTWVLRIRPLYKK